MSTENIGYSRRNGNAKGDSSPIDDRDYFEYMKTVIKGRADPVWFVTDVLHVKLFPMQEQIIREFFANKYNSLSPKLKKLIIVAGMRGGKTALAGIIMAIELFDTITLENPSEYYGLLRNQPIFLTAVATSEKLANDGIFQNMCNQIEGSEWFMTWGDLRIKSDRIDCDKKQVHAQVLGSWVNTAVGRSNKFVAFDELDLFENTTGKRGAWEIWSRLRKSTDTFGMDGHVMAISSPQSPTGIIMSLYKEVLEEKSKGIARSLSYLIPTWAMNPNMPEDALREEYKFDMPTFYRDFACMPEISGGIQFPEGVRLTPMENVLLSSLPTKIRVSRVLAIDPAVKNDSFGIACGYRHATGQIIIDGVHKFTKVSGDAYIKPSEIRSFVDAAIPRLNINDMVFDAWMFPELIEHVQTRFGIVAEKHIVRKEDYDRWRELQNDVEQPVLVVDNDDLKREANNLIVTNTSNPRTDHPFSGSKDMADCVANCIWFLSEYEHEPERPNVVINIAF